MEWDKNRIKAFRKKLSLNTTQFAELLGTSNALISYWERGKKKPSGPSRKALTYLAQIKGIDLEELKKIDASDFDLRKKQERKKR